MASSTAASEKRIIGWIEDMIDEQLGSSTDLSEALKDGVALCKLVNKIREGSVPYINTNPGVLNHLENISAYLQACWTLGVPTDAIFGTQDISQRRNIPLVIKNLDALATVTVSNDSYNGPPSEPATVTSVDMNSPAGTKTSNADDTKTSNVDPTEELLAENEELAEENQTLRKRIRKLQETVEDHEATIADRDKEVQDLIEKMADLNDKLTLALVELQQANEKVENLQESLQAANGAKGVVELSEQRVRRLSRLETELVSRSKANTELTARIHQLEEENKKLSHDLERVTEESESSSRSSSRTSLPDHTPYLSARESLTTRERMNSTPILPVHRERAKPRRRSNAFVKGEAGDPDTSPSSTLTREKSEQPSSYRNGVTLTPINVPTSPGGKHPKPLPPTPVSASAEISTPFPTGDANPISPRRPTSPESTSQLERPSSKDEKRKGLAARAIRGVKDKLKRSNKSDKVDQGHELTTLVKTIFTTPSALSFQDVVKVSFKKDTSRRLFSLILDQQINSFTGQKSYGLNPHSFDMLLYLVNASLLAMAEDTETDTIALQVLMRSAFFFFKKDRGVVQFMHEHVRSYDIWRRFEFWEEYFYSEVGAQAKVRKDDPKLVFTVLSEFVFRMRDFGVGGGLVQKLVNDVASKELISQEDVGNIMKANNPTPPVTPSAVSPTTVPVVMRHTFTQKSTKKPAWCDFCSEFIWGVAKVVYYCSECKYTIHRKCLDECLPHATCPAKSSVGTPFAVSHNVSVKKNANGGYEGLPKEWQDLLEQSGIEKNDVLANPHAVLHILEYHTQQRKRGENERIMPTPATQRPHKDTLSPLPLPQPHTPRESVGGDDSVAVAGVVPPAFEPDEPEEQEPATYSMEEIVTRENPATLYRDIHQIGQGANAEVFAGFSIKTGQKVAIKKIKWDTSKSTTLMNEIQIMKSSVHENIIRCTDCFLFDDELWVIMEFVDYGSLTDVLDQFPRGLQLTEAEIAFLCTQTLKALEYIHQLGIIHRDVKTDNILLGTDGRVLLADFGSAARLTATRPTRKTVIGSPYWMAPELIRGEEYTQKVDIFSFGCTLQELAVGEPPFSEYPPLKTLFLLATTDVPPLKNEDKRWSPLFIDFSNKCVRSTATNRPSASDLLLHPFLGLACTQADFTKVIQKAISYRDQILSVFGN